MTDRLSLAVAELVEALRDELRQEAQAGSRAPDRLLDIESASAALSLGRSLVYAEISAGRLRSIKCRRRRLIPASAIADYIAERSA